MITDEDAKQLTNTLLNQYIQQTQPDEVLPNQIYRGVSAYSWKNQHKGACHRHKHMFNKYNAIPGYCFNCFKITIQPDNVIQLIKLMMIFNQIELRDDNTRKCFTECRDNIAGTYGGLIYCMDLQDALGLKDDIAEIVKAEISSDITVGLKRGCTEYNIAYPSYAQVEHGHTLMCYRQEWKPFEEMTDNEFQASGASGDNRATIPRGYTANDAKALLSWLMYAATIGDTSYLKLTDNQPLPPLSNIRRTAFSR